MFRATAPNGSPSRRATTISDRYCSPNQFADSCTSASGASRSTIRTAAGAFAVCDPAGAPPGRGHRERAIADNAAVELTP
jgi:hypothetical protein